jgi:D-arabinitol 4-dehydrogenase
LSARAADPATRIVSVTVTEAGYHLDERGRLDLQHPEIAADLQGGAHTLYGALARLLKARMNAHAGPLTLLNCDNLRSNGERFREGLLQFLEARADTELLDWVQTYTTCPNAMVDRITPRPPAELKARVAAATGWPDEAPVMAEDFLQWVIEERFCNGRPEWERAGVQMVQDVRPYEEAKIRILNASHSGIAWAGTLRGHRYIHEGVRDAPVRALVEAYVTDDAIPCLHWPGHPSPVDLPAYRDSVLRRFGNAAIADTNQRVAADGFAKLAGFIVPTVRERLARGQSIAAVARLPALLLTFLQRWHDGALPFEYHDQAMDPARAHAICTAPDPLERFAREPQLWGGLAGDATLLRALRQARQEIQSLIVPGVPA